MLEIDGWKLECKKTKNPQKSLNSKEDHHKQSQNSFLILGLPLARGAGTRAQLHPTVLFTQKILLSLTDEFFGQHCTVP